MEHLTIENLSFSYPGREEKALENISFRVNEGDFICVLAPTGSGKSTLLRLIKKELSPVGEKSGRVLFRGTDTEQLSQSFSAKHIGFVAQNPDEQIVTDKVWHELAFSAESLGMEQNEIRRLAAETAGFFGIDKWFYKNTDELSGGQKQLLNLAAATVTKPELLLLDEPTAQLDPIAARDFLSMVKRLQTELSVTVILVEHRLEDVIPLSNRLLILDKGKLIDYGKTAEVCARTKDEKLIRFLPCAVRVHRLLNSEKPCPLTIREGRLFLTDTYKNDTDSLPPCDPPQHSEKKALEISSLYFRYAKDAPDVLTDINLTVYEGESLMIVGANGSGKSTALSAVARLVTPYAGQIRLFGKKLKTYKETELYKENLAMLPQSVQTLFDKDTVQEELTSSGFSGDFPFDFTMLYDRHPYDLSGGEQQLLAFAKLLTRKPRLLLLDEPTKGLDVNTKGIIGQIIEKLKRDGVTIITVTHDMEFACRHADRCALFFCGSVVCVQPAADFFSSNTFYTTSASRMTRGFYRNVLTAEDAIRLCLLNGERDKV